MAFDPDLLVGLDFAYRRDSIGTSFKAWTSATTPTGVMYGNESDGPIETTVLGPEFICSGPKGQVTCRAGVEGTVTREYSIPLFAEEVVPRVVEKVSDLPDVDFYSIRGEIPLALVFFPAIGCDPGGSGIFDPGPDCILDESATVGQGNLLDVTLDGPDAPPVTWSFNHATLVNFTIARTDPSAQWPYQNPDPTYADQGQFLFTPQEVNEIRITLGNLFAGRVDFSEELTVTPWKWLPGFGPPEAGFMCVL